MKTLMLILLVVLSSCGTSRREPESCIEIEEADKVSRKEKRMMKKEAEEITKNMKNIFR